MDGRCRGDQVGKERVEPHDLSVRTVCPGSALMRQTGVFCERRKSGFSHPQRSEDEADIRACEEGLR